MYCTTAPFLYIAQVVELPSARWRNLCRSLLALAALPGLVLTVPIVVLLSIVPEMSAVLPVGALALLLATLLPQLALATGRLREEHQTAPTA